MQWPTRICDFREKFGCAPYVVLKSLVITLAENPREEEVLVPGDLVVLPITEAVGAVEHGIVRAATARQDGHDFRPETQILRYTWPVQRPRGCPLPKRRKYREHHLNPVLLPTGG